MQRTSSSCRGLPVHAEDFLFFSLGFFASPSSMPRKSRHSCLTARQAGGLRRSKRGISAWRKSHPTITVSRRTATRIRSLKDKLSFPERVAKRSFAVADAVRILRLQPPKGGRRSVARIKGDLVIYVEVVQHFLDSPSTFDRLGLELKDVTFSESTFERICRDRPITEEDRRNGGRR